MKRLIQFLAVAALLVVIIWGIKEIFTDKSNGLGNTTDLKNATEFEAIPTNYLPVAPFSGPDFTSAAEKTVHGVVHIKSEFAVRTGGYDDFFAPFRDFFGYPYGGNNTYTGFGSGVIISNDGYIVTNNHVVEGADNVDVTLNDNSEYEATVIGTDPTTDLALLKIESDNTPFISLNRLSIDLNLTYFPLFLYLSINTLFMQ